MEIMARVGSPNDTMLGRIASQWRLHGWRLSAAAMALSLPFWLGIGVLHGVLTWWVVGGPVLTAALLNTAAALATVATRAADKADAVATAATWWAVLFVLSIIGRGLMT